MEVTVRYFAVLRERLGLASEALTLPDGACVADLLELVRARHTELTPLLPVTRAAVNQALAPPDAALADGDEVALLPPVAGGAPDDDRFRLTADPLDVEAVVEAATAGDPGLGGLVTFVGQVRDHSEGREVVRLEYEAYPEMAARVLREIGEEAEARWPGVRLAVHHRVGVLEVGERAVVIVAAAPHRAEAFAARRDVIERIKEDCPIWKREIGPGGARWVGAGS